MNEKKKKKKNEAGAKSGKYAELVAPRLYYVQSLAAADVPEAAIAEKLGISRQTFAKYKKEYPALARAISKGREDICENIRSALYKRAMGYDYEEERTTIKDGVETSEWMYKHCPADIRAAEILLRQYDPQFRDKGEPQDTGHEGVTVMFDDGTLEGGI